HLETQHYALNLDLARVGTLLPGEVGKGIRGRTVEHASVKAEPRAMARAVEARLGMAGRRLGQRHRAAEVRAVDREDIDLALVLDHKAAKGELARCVVAATVGHDERRVRVPRGVEFDRV